MAANNTPEEDGPEELVAHGDIEGALLLVAGNATRLSESVDKKTAWNRAGILASLVVAAFGMVIGAIGLHEVQRANASRDTRIAVACADRLHGYRALRAEIIEQNRAQVPSKQILDALPEFKPFFTPGNPLYDAQVRAANGKRDRILRVLGPRPVCK